MAWIKRFFLLIFAACLSSCGIYSLSGASVSPEVKTFRVIQFPNNASLVNPQLSQILSDKLRIKVQNETRLRLSPAEADLQFEGVITDYSIAPASVGTGDRTSLNRLTIKVKIICTNLKEPKSSYEQEFTRYSDFSDPVFASVESKLTDEITRQLTDDIFNRTFINW